MTKINLLHSGRDQGRDERVACKTQTDFRPTSDSRKYVYVRRLEEGKAIELSLFSFPIAVFNMLLRAVYLSVYLKIVMMLVFFSSGCNLCRFYSLNFIIKELS